jgi:hypothetical protein
LARWRFAMVVAPSTSVEERRVLRELQRKLRVLDKEIERLRVAGDAESLRVSHEHLQTRKAIWAAYCDLRDRIDRRFGLAG